MHLHHPSQAQKVPYKHELKHRVLPGDGGSQRGHGLTGWGQFLAVSAQETIPDVGVEWSDTQAVPRSADSIGGGNPNPPPGRRQGKTRPWCVPWMRFQWAHVGNAARPRHRRVLAEDTPLKPLMAPRYMGDPQPLSGWWGWQSLKPPRGTRWGA